MKYRIILFVHALLICLLQLIPNTIISATWAGGPDKIIYNRYSFFGMYSYGEWADFGILSYHFFHC